jgi:ABC-2 type transport system permease protein
MPNYIRIEALRMIRNKRYVIFVVAFPVAFYLLYSSLWGGQVDAATGRPASVILMVSMAAYGALATSMMSSAVPWAQERTCGWLRQLRVTPLSRWTIIATKLVASLLLVLPSLLLVCLAAVLTQHVRLSAGQWLALIPVMWLGTIPFAALGLTIGSLLPAESAQPAAIASMFGLAVLGGLWFPIELMPAAMRSIMRALPSYEYASIGWRIVSGNLPEVSAVAGLVGWGVVLGVAAVLSYRRATVRG